MNNAYKPAYPPNADWEHSEAKGLTKREVFAMAAMQGIIAGFDPESKCNGCYIPNSEYPHLMVQAVQIADELLKQLENE